MNYFDLYPKNGSILIEGVAGGGKSTLIAKHAAECVRIKAKTLLITFSQSGKDVLNKYMQREGLHPQKHADALTVHTIDGLALTIVERWGDRRHILRKNYITRNILPSLLDKAEERLNGLDPFPGKFPHDLNNLMRDIDFFRASGAYRLEYEEDREIVCEGNLNFPFRIVQTIFYLYDDLRQCWIPDPTSNWITGLEDRKRCNDKEAIGFRTFSEAVTDLLDHPRHTEQLDAISRLFNFKYVLIDEFHDTTPLQLEFLIEICKNSIKTMAVGDKHQNIYGWRGADPEVVFEKFKEYFKPITIPLNRSFRFSSRLAFLLGKLTKTQWESLSEHKTVVNFTHDSIGKLLIDLHKRDMLFNTAIICRDSSHLAETGFRSIDSLKKIGFSLSFDLGSAFSCRIVTFLTAIRLPDLPWNKFVLRESVREFLSLPHCLHNEKAREEMLSGATSASNLRFTVELQIQFNTDFYSKDMAEAIQFWLSDISIDTSFTKSLRLFQEKANLLHAASAAARHNVASQNMLRSWNAVIEYLDSHKIEMRQWVNTLRNFSSMRDERYSIELLSVEAAKGREFDNVIVYGLNNGSFPANGEDLRLERNRFYVASSRARKFLLLSADSNPGIFFSRWKNNDA